MNIRVASKDDVQEWDSFVFSNNKGHICHLYYYYLTKFYNKNVQLINLLSRKGDKIFGIMPLILDGNRLISFGGPLVAEGYEYLQYEFIKYVYKNFLTKLRVFIIKQSGLTIPNNDLEWLKKYGFNPEVNKTTILRLCGRSTEDIFKGLNKKNRNAIRKAIKHGVKIEKKCNSVEDFNYFGKIHKIANIQKGRKPYQSNYWNDVWYKIMANYYGVADLYFANVDGKRVAGVIVGRFGKKAFYAAGSFLREYGKFQPNNLIHWEVIQDLVNDKFELYEFGDVGINSPDPQVKGIAKFKLSWGGEIYDKVSYYKHSSILSRILDNMDGLKVAYRIIYRKIRNKITGVIQNE